MKISLKWLSEFFPEMEFSALIEKSEMLREKLPLAGLEIGGWKRMGSGLEDVRVAQILEFSKHPNADKLNVCKVATGKPGEVLQIVCGAPNVKAGAKIALAPVGCTLPGDFKIKQAAIRGVDSSGMLCSEKELGLSEESNGIMILPDSAPVGSPLVKALGLSDEVWEVELTPDRGDCLSHLGIAREVARLLDATVKLPESDDLSPSDSGDVPMLSVEVQAQKLCPIYGAQLFEGVSNVATPEWMRRSLDKLGVRSHNAVVDTTNYVLFELGHPLHAFDADKLVGSKLIVRLAKKGETLVTLDGEKRTLSNEDLVIADAEKPVALAGVMGGLDSGVTESTKRVVLESAVFDMNTIRATARRHKIHSEASHRFERGVDITGALRSGSRASKLLREVSGARRRGAYIELRSEKIDKLTAKHVLNFNLRTFKEVVGMDVAPEELIKAFRSAGIDASLKSTNVLKVEVPSHRLDLSREIDLVEEAARLLGYGNIPERYPPQLSRTPSVSGGLYAASRRLRRRLVETGLAEMMPYDFVSSAQTAHLPGLRALEIMNPLSAEWQFLRPNLFFGLLNVVTRHAALGQLKGAFFDLGAVFEARDQKVEPAVKEKEKSETAPVRDIGAREAWHVGWALMGPRNVEHWSSDKTSSDRKAQADFFDAKGVCEQVLDGLSGIEPIWNAAQFTALDEALADPKVKAVIERDAPWIPLTLLHPGRSALVTLPGAPPGRIVGYVGELHPGAKRELLNLPAGLQLGVAVGELRWVPDLVAVLEKGQEAAEAFRGAVPRGKIQASRMLPVVERDVALVFTADTRAGEVAKTLKKAGGDELLDVECVDRFVLPDQKVSLAWRLWIQGKDKTLSDAEIQEIMGRALKSVQEKHGAIMRS